MIRNESPYNGKRILYITNTEEVHVLEHETLLCKIAEIKTEHIVMFSSIIEAQTYIFINGKRFEGCRHCLYEYHTN